MHGEGLKPHQPFHIRKQKYHNHAAKYNIFQTHVKGELLSVGASDIFVLKGGQWQQKRLEYISFSVPVSVGFCRTDITSFPLFNIGLKEAFEGLHNIRL